MHVDEIVRSCHLIPKMGPSVDPSWNSANIYELASDFYINTFIDESTHSVSQNHLHKSFRFAMNIHTSGKFLLQTLHVLQTLLVPTFTTVTTCHSCSTM